MSVIDIFSVIVLLIIIGISIGLFVFLGMWPGKIAKTNKHPQVEAITIGSWVALIAGGVLWPLILIWSYMKPVESSKSKADQALQDKVEILEERIKALELSLEKGETS